MNFKDKTVVVTGASSGIGDSCAKKLLDLGSKIAGFDVKPGKIIHERFKTYIVDVSDENSVKAAVDEVEGSFGKIDALINCAGISSSYKPFYDIIVDEWEKVISVNLKGTFLCSKYVSQKMMKNKKGKIVNISCIRSRVFGPNMADYSASKGGVVALTSAMALDLAPFNIQVNSVAPGATITGITEKRFSNPEVRTTYEKLIPLGRIAQPDDIAEVVIFLISDSSNYLTGETVFVDGGYSISK